MQRIEVEKFFDDHKKSILKGIVPCDNPVAVLLGGQPASGKTKLTIQVQKDDHPDVDFLVVNGDEFRSYHPHYSELRKDILAYSEQTQIFSSVFTEQLIEEALRNQFNIIIEGTMRNRDIPLATAMAFKEAGFQVEAHVIAAPELFTQLGIFNRYQDEVAATGSGRLADVNSHNEAVKGLLSSIDTLFRNNAVDKIAIYSYGAHNKIKNYRFDGKLWNCYISPIDAIRQSREEQLRDSIALKERIDAGKQTLRLIDDKFKHSVSQILDELLCLAVRNEQLSAEKTIAKNMDSRCSRKE